MKKDKPVLFSTPMIHKLIAGQKTQTRRLLAFQPGEDDRVFQMDDESWHTSGPDGTHMSPLRVPYAIGDRLWVRESWRVGKKHDAVAPRDMPWDYGLTTMFAAGGSRAFGSSPVYRNDFSYPTADGSAFPTWAGKVRPGIFLPRVASRITLEVTDVRVQHLSAITEDDARAEGFEEQRLNDGFGPREIGSGWTIESSGTLCSPAGSFQIYWQKLHPDWDGYSDPWVVAPTFKVILENIDQVPP